MPYVSHVLPGLFALKWGVRPDAADMYAYTKELALAYNHQGKKLHALFVIPRDSPVPDEAARKAQTQCLPEIYRYVTLALVVFEGKGFALAMKRSVLTAIFMLAPKQYVVEVRNSVEEALVLDPPRGMTIDGPRALEQLRALGFA